MATAYPHFDELQVMTYEPKPRECKELYQIPRRHDFIEVLWCMDHLPALPNRWCPAEVLHISGPPDREYLAKGVMLYMPGETWDEQIEKVEFLHECKLRCAANGDEEDCDVTSGSTHSKNDNPSLEWRFRGEKEELTDSDLEHSNWEDGISQVANVEHGFALSRARKREANKDRSSHEMEFKALRSGHASLVVEVEKLKRELVRISHHLAALQKPNAQHERCTSAGCVLPRLRQKLALKMQTSLREASATARKRKHTDSEESSSILHIDGVHPGVIKVRVECTMQQFESLCLQIRTRSSPETVLFFPDFSYTQLPLKCSSAFRILFKRFSNLCDSIGIISAADKKEVARKCGKGPKGDILRMLGTYSFDEDNERSAAHFYPGTSCGDSPPSATAEYIVVANATSEHRNMKHVVPVLTRKTREWNSVDGRYRHNLRKQVGPLPALTEECTERQAFAISWKKAAEVGGRACSQALCDSGEVFGWLDVILPFIQTQGKHRCQELGGLASDDVWDVLLDKDE